jgi:tRNA threonylcarbamoyladenosine biosynthesis protein TsaE
MTEPDAILQQLCSGCTTTSPDATTELAAHFAGALPDNCAVTLSGDLGTGKTTFVRGLASGLGVREIVTSPTYQFYSIYQGKRHQLVHLDAYRIQSPEALESLYIDELLREPFILAIEWPENATPLIDGLQVFALQLSTLPDQQHSIRLA